LEQAYLRETSSILKLVGRLKSVVAEQRQLTHPRLVLPAGSGGTNPGAWSPDGTRIAYSSGQFRGREVWIMNADGTRKRRVTHWPGADGPVAWLPNGPDRVLPLPPRRAAAALLLDQAERDGHPVAYSAERARRSDRVAPACGAGPALQLRARRRLRFALVQ
jgi:hypothetical protein